LFHLSSLVTLCLFALKNVSVVSTVIRFFQDYTEPSESQPSTPAPPRYDANPLHPTPQQTEEEKVVLPLSDQVLSHNLGIPIVVVLTKVSISLSLSVVAV
jgi:hypothetical protein